MDHQHPAGEAARSPAAPGDGVVRVAPAPPVAPPAAEVGGTTGEGPLRRATLAALGGAELVGTAALEAFDAVARRSEGAPTGAGAAPVPPTRAGMLPTAILGAGLEVHRRASAVAGGARAAISGVLPRVLPPPDLDAELVTWHRRGASELERGREAFVALVQRAVGEIVQLVVSQVDLNRILAEIDLDELLARVDLQGLLERVDVAAVVEQIDLEAIVRDSSGALAGETVTALRVQGMRADDTVARIVDRVLRRNRPAPPAATSGGEL